VINIDGPLLQSFLNLDHKCQVRNREIEKAEKSTCLILFNYMD
jgi:hypothetical protein